LCFRRTSSALQPSVLCAASLMYDLSNSFSRILTYLCFTEHYAAEHWEIHEAGDCW
jgi:hypothetical protein